MRKKSFVTVAYLFDYCKHLPQSVFKRLHLFTNSGYPIVSIPKCRSHNTPIHIINQNEIVCTRILVPTLFCFFQLLSFINLEYWCSVSNDKNTKVFRIIEHIFLGMLYNYYYISVQSYYIENYFSCCHTISEI